MTEPSISPRDDAGKVYLKDSRLYWDSNNENLLQADLSSLKALGEYTTIHAVHINEWFLVLILKDNQTYQISMYARGMKEVLSKLSLAFQAPVIPLLSQKRDFGSNIIYPPFLAGQELYELKVTESKSWFDRFRARLGFGNPVELVLTEKVAALPFI